MRLDTATIKMCWRRHCCQRGHAQEPRSRDTQACSASDQTPWKQDDWTSSHCKLLRYQWTASFGCRKFVSSIQTCACNNKHLDLPTPTVTQSSFVGCVSRWEYRQYIQHSSWYTYCVTHDGTHLKCCDACRDQNKIWCPSPCTYWLHWSHNQQCRTHRVRNAKHATNVTCLATGKEASCAGEVNRQFNLALSRPGKVIWIGVILFQINGFFQVRLQHYA